MDIQQIVYTKINDGESPWGKSDFHTAFYPINIMTEQDISELERKIYVHDLALMSGKKVVFYQKIMQEYYLVLLFFTNLPDDEDSFGRCGIFLVHGFLFPQALWQQSLSPMDLSALVLEHVFSSRDDLLDSDSINRKTGNIHPLNVTEKQLSNISDNPRPHLILEKKVYQLLINMAMGASVELLIQGTAEQVFNYMCNIITVIPDDLKVFIGWDSAYESGNLFFFQLKIVGFSSERPMAKKPVVVDAATATIVEQPEDGEMFKAVTPFQLWLDRCEVHTATKSSVEGLYRLSLLLDKGVPFKGAAPVKEMSCFIKVNKEKISNVFNAGCAQLLGEKISSLITQQLSPDVMLDILIAGLPFKRLAEHVVEVIFSFNVTPTQAGRQLPEQLLISDYPELVLVDKVWRGGQLTFSDFELLHSRQSLVLVRYLLKSKWLDTAWLVDLFRLPGSDAWCSQLLMSPDTAESLNRLLVRFLNSQKTPVHIAELLTGEIVRQRRMFQFLRGEVNPFDILENALRDDQFENEELILLTAWLSNKNLPLHGKPFLNAFVNPAHGISMEVLRLPGSQFKLLSFLITFKSYKQKDLQIMGFGSEEVERALTEKTAGSLLTRLKGFIRR